GPTSVSQHAVESIAEGLSWLCEFGGNGALDFGDLEVSAFDRARAPVDTRGFEAAAGGANSSGDAGGVMFHARSEGFLVAQEQEGFSVGLCAPLVKGLGEQLGQS